MFVTFSHSHSFFFRCSIYSSMSIISDTELFFSFLFFVHAFFQGANLQGVKMLCTNAEGASLKGCNFEDPAGLKANLEGKMSTLDF